MGTGDDRPVGRSLTSFRPAGLTATPGEPSFPFFARALVIKRSHTHKGEISVILRLRLSLYLIGPAERSLRTYSGPKPAENEISEKPFKNRKKWLKSEKLPVGTVFLTQQDRFRPLDRRVIGRHISPSTTSPHSRNDVRREPTYM